ncbi:MAG: MFS transporter [Promicromonosporaceae bacterium]|nr:MFS transporter [Promicromonosporaceae bacterium]
MTAVKLSTKQDMLTQKSSVIHTTELSQARQARAALLVLFGMFGVLSTAWAGRAPSVREALEVSVGQFGNIIVVGAIGSLVSVAASGVITPRLGSRRSLLVSFVGAFFGLLISGVALFLGSVPLFTAGILLNGLATPILNVTQNLEGARVEQVLGKPVLPQMHAAFPIGAVLGSGLAALSARAEIPVGWHLVFMALAATVVRFYLINRATQFGATPVRGSLVPNWLRKLHRRSGSVPAVAARVGRSPWTEPRTIMLGVLLMAATMSEGSAGNWLNLSVVESFHSPEEFGALAYATFVVSMLTVRLLGARLLQSFGRVKVLYVSGATALVGLLIFTGAPALPLAWIGIVFWGAGAAMAWPTVMGAAADEPERAPGRLAVTSTFSSFSMLVAPPLLGMLGDAWGLRNALMLIAIPLVVALFVVRAAKPIGEAASESDPKPTTAQVPLVKAA